VAFEIFFKTMPGESLSVVGSIEELGVWKNYAHELEWTEGHYWVSKKPLFTDFYSFQYKYVLLENEELVNWEGGINRIAELNILSKSDKPLLGMEGVRAVKG
jgi:hypothetical protein